MQRATPRVGVPEPDAAGGADAIREAGGEPVPVYLPEAPPGWGVALMREWIADQAEVSASQESLDALLLSAERPEKLAGLLAAALRLDLPVVLATRPENPFSVALAALGLAPLVADPAEAAVEVARAGGTRSLAESFSLANALRAGCSLGGGPEMLVHLSAVAREAGAQGFSQMMRVLAPESPAVAEPGSGWFREHGAAGLLATLGDALHDVRTVSGRLKENLPPAPPTPEAPGTRLVFVRGRASGTEAVCRVSGPATEIAGGCRVFASEETAARAVLDGELGGEILVVVGYGPRGGFGLPRLERLGRALDAADGNATVLTDGLLPDGVPGTHVSLFTPEAAAGGIVGRLRDGDTLRIDLGEGRIRTGVGAEEFGARQPYKPTDRGGVGYAARHARSALPALEGAGFG